MDLIGKFRQILIGSALIPFNYTAQAFASSHQAGKDAICSASALFLRLDRDTPGYLQPGALCQIIHRSTEWRRRRNSLFPVQPVCKNVSHLIISMDDKGHLRFFFICADPPDQTILVCVPA